MLNILSIVLVFCTISYGITAEYEYGEVIGLSLLFYEAQRCGKLPENNRIPYRGDSFLDDKDGSVDLVGGYFDAGDLVKFGFTFASTATVLNWGLAEYIEAYDSVGQKEHALGTARWSLDYLIKCHPSPYEFYGQTADADLDNSIWSRPEDWPAGPRQSWKITQDNPGSELAGEAAAAFASGYFVFKSIDSEYAQTLLQHAKELYEFANNYRGTYTNAIPAEGFYDSWTGYGDELGWAAAWLYRATNDAKYLTDLESHWTEFNLGSRASKFSWDDKKAGVQILMARLSGEQKYKDAAEEFCRYMIYNAPRTPKGLVYLGEWGSLRYSSNTAFLCLLAAGAGIRSVEFRTFSKEQIHYALGDSGRSFVVGFGNSPPTKPHHRASSCPDRPAPCNRTNSYDTPEPNPQTLYGALVGGPDINDNYIDNREDYVQNEVAIDYNAGFQSALAALQKLKNSGELP